MRFENRVALVTGASSGIGRALAKALAAEGCAVGLTARREGLLEELTREIAEAGGNACFAVADAADRAQVAESAAKIAAKLGPIDLLIANAGMSQDVTLEPLNVETTEQIFRVNFFGVLRAIEAVLPDMLQRRSGHLAVVSSLGSYKGMPGKQAYTASKAALNNYLEGLRMQLRGRGVDVTTICPGFVRTPMTQKFKSTFLALEADDAARRILRAVHRRKKVFNFPWMTAKLMGLTRWLPDWLISRLARRYLD